MRKIVIVMGIVLVGALAVPAFAQASGGGRTPSQWNYEIKDGKRVPKAARQTKADGSWREEVRQGKCSTIKEKTSDGDYREVRSCD